MPLVRELQPQGPIPSSNGSNVRSEMEEKQCHCVFSKNIPKALKRIFFKMRKQNFNCLEVTKMVESHFLGVPYITVCTHPHHVFVLSLPKEGSLLTAA